MKKLALAGFAAALAVIALCAARALMLSGPPPSEGAILAADPARGAEVAARLSRAIRFRTISWGDGRAPDAEAFAGFAGYLEEAYPAAHAAMTRETVNAHSLLYRWAGTDAGAKPIGFIAHIDVVPIEPGTEDQWTRPPFSGAIHDGAVWGRGALDNKGQIIALMEAAERLAAAGFRPTRDVYFLFGHDEELGGHDGAGATRALLDERGVHFAWTLDEGSGLVEGIIPGVERPVALISTAEKGSTTLRFTAHAPGGHSSTPGPDTAVSLVARAVAAVTDNPHPLEFDENVVAFLHAIAPELPFAQRLVLANLWLTGPIVKKQLAADRVTAASMRTTTAATIIEGGTKVNVLPQQASAIVNYRIHPRDSVEGVRERAKRLIDDERVTIETLGGVAPSPQASTEAEGYRAVAQSVTAVFGPVAVAPSLTLQGTDTRHYVGAADDNYRFTPFIYRTDDLARIHGTDERVMIEDLVRGAAFYEDLIRRAAGP
ncbi:M20 family peptidase [Amphiplicatus metriothermophilus]|uniref:Carboxypeptidase PM20D1 n=1 Tax=Amphiplicatus metriothermophilus TaxID=1519374 RepID=A0A239PIE3_9PROT|nr:M20 family peptidase [Amphiplicatus metriothermophilus]MBB5518110.1 carboxypeptidase PM20D1 [Amphiplicatus metriothermophilus]SNT67556.1 carboxypeptidase PM20D1 [Amphiplicatus metriothermophilus]